MSLLRNEWPPSISPFRDYIRVKGGHRATGEKPAEGTVAIVIPVRNGMKFFKLCFYSVMDFTDVPFMMTVVDHLGNLDTKKLLNALSLNHQIYIERFDEEEFNYAREVNLGLRKAFQFPQVKYGLILNADTVVEPYWLSNLIKVAESNPDIGIVGPSTNKANPEQINTNKRNEFEVAQRVSGFCMLFKREVWEALDGFDEQFEGGGFEDWDFCERARRRGWHVIIDKQTYIHHFYKQYRLNDFNAQMRVNEERFFKKHPLVLDLVHRGNLLRAESA